jgi:hypothetical protein
MEMDSTAVAGGKDFGITGRLIKNLSDASPFNCRAHVRWCGEATTCGHAQPRFRHPTLDEQKSGRCSLYKGEQQGEECSNFAAS